MAFLDDKICWFWGLPLKNNSSPRFVLPLTACLSDSGGVCAFNKVLWLISCSLVSSIHDMIVQLSFKLCGCFLLEEGWFNTVAPLPLKGARGSQGFSLLLVSDSVHGFKYVEVITVLLCMLLVTSSGSSLLFRRTRQLKSQRMLGAFQGVGYTSNRHGFSEFVEY
jgi:hypothetical protein